MTMPCNTDNFDDLLTCLHDHLQAICAVEFYTIPLYLTATYSFSTAAGNSSYSYTPSDSCQTTSAQPLFWWMQQKSLSVAVQEMYHLQCASNIANALGFHPKLDPAIFDWTGPVPHLPSVTGIGFNNLENVLSVLIGIETPITGGFPPPNMEVEYDSISALYHATLTLLDIIIVVERSLPFETGPALPSGTAATPSAAPDQMNYLTFQSRYQYTVVKCRADIAHLANAVSFQGEGAGVTSSFEATFPNLAAVLDADASLNSGQVPAQYQPAKGSRFANWGCASHYERFVSLNTMITAGNNDYSGAVAALPEGRSVFNSIGTEDPDRPAWVAAATELQNCINLAYSRVLDVINAGMISGGGLDPASSTTGFTFTQVMTAFKYLIPQLWQWGQVPTFTYQAGVTDAQLQAAFDMADPLCLYHWDSATLDLRNTHPDELNICQGLNTCSGRGWGKLSTKAGDGACATVDIHTCVGGNSCKHKGACGFVATDQQGSPYPCDDLWVPGWNDCKGQGGCQVPISTMQKFGGTLPATCTGRTVAAGASVWEEARKLLQKNEKLTSLPDPTSATGSNGVDYDGTKRRNAITPTST